MILSAYSIVKTKKRAFANEYRERQKMRETHSTRQSQSRTNLISQQPGEDEIAQSQPAAAHRWDNLVETFYCVSLEEKCICLS